MAGYAPPTLGRAKRLRRDMTDAEKVLWQQIRNQRLGVKFRRQPPLGSFIADFVCQDLRLIVELDVGQHADSLRDRSRTAWFAHHGYRVIRLRNHDVLNNLQGALETISAALNNTPHPPIAAQWVPPSPSRGEGTMDGDALV